VKNFKQKKITCFNLTKSVNTIVVCPQSFNELEECLESSTKKKFKIAIKGAGNSFSDVYLNSDQLLIDTSSLNSIKSFDPKSGIVIVEPGVRIGDLLGMIMPAGWGLVGLSGSINDLIGGMVSSNTHGKDTWKNGNFGQNIASLKIMLANGETIEACSQKNPELLNGVVGGLGFLGIVIEITLRLKPLRSFMVKVTKRRIHDFDQLYDFFYSLERSGSEFAYAMLDAFASKKNMGKGTCVSSTYLNFKNCSKSEFKKCLSYQKKKTFLKPEKILEKVRPFWGDTACSIINKLRYSLYHDRLNKPFVQPYSKFQYVWSPLPHFNLIYSPSGFWEFHLIFPKEKAICAFIELLEVSRRFKCQPWICMIKRHKPDTAYLSFSGDGLSISMNFSLNHIDSDTLNKYCNTLFEITLKYNGKNYLAKHAIIPRSIFQEMYPQYRKISILKNKYDPGLVFSSDATKRLFL